MKFEQHGHYYLWRERNVIYAELHGTWNQIAAENFEQEFKHLASSIESPWAHLVYLNDWELCGPEMFPIITRLVDWCINHGLTKAANVFSQSALKENFVNKMVVQEEGDFIRSVFDNETDAIAWLNSEGFAVTTKQK